MNRQTESRTLDILRGLSNFSLQKMAEKEEEEIKYAPNGYRAPDYKHTIYTGLGNYVKGQTYIPTMALGLTGAAGTALGLHTLNNSLGFLRKNPLKYGTIATAGALAGGLAGGSYYAHAARKGVDTRYNVSHKYTKEEKDYMDANNPSFTTKHPGVRAGLVGGGAVVYGIHEGFKGPTRILDYVTDATKRELAGESIPHSTIENRVRTQLNRTVNRHVPKALMAISAGTAAAAYLSNTDKNKYLKFRKDMAEHLGQSNES